MGANGREVRHQRPAERGSMLASESEQRIERSFAERLTVALKIMSEIAAADSGYCAVLHAADQLSLSDMEDEFRLYGEMVVDRIAALFTIYTGYESNVCIKICNFSPDIPSTSSFAAGSGRADRPFVYSFWRDSKSSDRRHKVDSDPQLGVYSISENTGLMKARQDGYWFCNDLSALGTSYISKNRDWTSYYNATSVAAIAPPCETGPVNPNGFLCVDNMGGGFDSQACYYIMSILANILHYSMWMTTQIAHKKGGDDDEGP
jgi:hypothetical protein